MLSKSAVNVVRMRDSLMMQFHSVQKIRNQNQADQPGGDSDYNPICTFDISNMQDDEDDLKFETCYSVESDQPKN